MTSRPAVRGGLAMTRRVEREVRFNRPAIVGDELDYVRQVMLSGRSASGGPFSERAAALLTELTAAEEVLLTTSCTAALELSAMLLDVGPADTVVVPSFTFTTTALAYARQGARLLFCDISPRTLGLDPQHLASLLDDSVRAVVAVHYGGAACDLDELRAVLRHRPDVSLVEDNAHGLFGSYKGRPLGSFGRHGTVSFHETKNLTCGEGGALLLNDPRDVARARVLHEKGTNRRAFLLGEVDKYSWQDTGSSFALADVLAAYLLGQLEQWRTVQARRRAVYEAYHQRLAPLQEELGFSLAPGLPDRDLAYHLFYVLLRDRDQRDRVLSLLRDAGVQATFHYVPLHSSTAGRRFAARDTECRVTTDIAGRLLRLPFHNDLSVDEVDLVVEALVEAVTATAG